MEIGLALNLTSIWQFCCWNKLNSFSKSIVDVVVVSLPVASCTLRLHDLSSYIFQTKFVAKNVLFIRESGCDLLFVFPMNKAWNAHAIFEQLIDQQSACKQTGWNKLVCKWELVNRMKFLFFSAGSLHNFLQNQNAIYTIAKHSWIGSSFMLF